MKHHFRAAVLVTLLTAGLSSAAVPIVSKAQSSKQSMHIGLIAYGEGAMGPHLYRSLLEGLRKQGYIEGRNLIVERRYADAHFERVAVIAKELADLKLDAILTTCTPTTRAMRAVSHGTPIVMAAVSDPVGQGLISSYSHPGGNITGTASQFEDLMAKMLGQFREAVPQVASMAVIHNPRNAVHKRFLADIEAAAQPISLTLTPFTVSRPDDVVPAFDGIRRGAMGAVLVLPDDPVPIQHASPHCRAVDRPPLAILFRHPRGGRGGRFHELWGESASQLFPLRLLPGPDRQRGEARGTAGRAADQVRACHQSQNRQGTWPYRSKYFASSC